MHYLPLSDREIDTLDNDYHSFFYAYWDCHDFDDDTGTYDNVIWC